jgi:hypothetical protein
LIPGRLRQGKISAGPAWGDRRSRLDQIVDWLGADFGGVIVFDEAHAMASDPSRDSHPESSVI